jgi:hypothetical protein
VEHPDLQANIGTGRKVLPGTNALVYFGLFILDDEKSFERMTQDSIGKRPSSRLDAVRSNGAFDTQHNNVQHNDTHQNIIKM